MKTIKNLSFYAVLILLAVTFQTLSAGISKKGVRRLVNRP